MFTCIYCKNQNENVWITLCEIHLVLCFSCRKPALLCILGYLTCLLSVELRIAGHSFLVGIHQLSRNPVFHHLVSRGQFWAAKPSYCRTKTLYRCIVQAAAWRQFLRALLDTGWVPEHSRGWGGSLSVGSMLASVTARGVFKGPFLAWGEGSARWCYRTSPKWPLTDSTTITPLRPSLTAGSTENFLSEYGEYCSFWGNNVQMFLECWWRFGIRSRCCFSLCS